MKKLPSSPCAWSAWPNPMKRIYQVLGVQGNRIPLNKHGVFKIDGWTIVLKRGKGGTRGGRKTRLFVDVNGRLVPAGRVRQALCPRALHRARKKTAWQRGAGGRFEWRQTGYWGQ